MLFFLDGVGATGRPVQYPKTPFLDWLDFRPVTFSDISDQADDITSPVLAAEQVVIVVIVVVNVTAMLRGYYGAAVTTTPPPNVRVFTTPRLKNNDFFFTSERQFEYY